MKAKRVQRTPGAGPTPPAGAAADPFSRALMEIAPALIVTVQHGRVVQVNEHYLRMSGYAREEVLGQPFEQFLHPEQRERLLAQAEQHLRGAAVPANFEFRHILKSGEQRWADCRTTLIDFQGQPAILAVAVDVTDRKRMEAALREAEHKYQRLYDSMQEAYVRTDLDGRILEFNEPFRALLGYPKEGLLQRSHQDVTPVQWHAMETTILLGPVLERGHSDVYEKEYRRQDGSVFPAELRAFLLRDEHGHPCAMWALVRDITARKQATYALQNTQDKLESKVLGRTIELVETIVSLRREINEREQAEAALKREKALTDAIINSMPGTFYVLDVHANFVRWNQTQQELAGMTAEQIRAAGALSFVHVEDRPAARAKLAEALQVGYGEIEVRIRFRPDGPVRHYLLTGRRMALGSEVFLVGCGIDITERKRVGMQIVEAIEREQRRIGHDLHDGVGQQITGLRFLSAALQRKLKEKKIAEHKMAERFEELLNEALQQVRTLSRGLHPVHADQQGLMSSLGELAQQVTRLFGLPCLFECPAPVLVADGQVATNLYRIAQEATRNAAAHAAPQHIWIRLLTSADGLHLVIQDDGHGLPPVKPGRQGLGLDIMKYRAASIGATFELQSTTATGTTIRCVLPPLNAPGEQHRANV